MAKRLRSPEKAIVYNWISVSPVVVAVSFAKLENRDKWAAFIHVGKRVTNVCEQPRAPALQNRFVNSAEPSHSFVEKPPDAPPSLMFH